MATTPDHDTHADGAGEQGYAEALAELEEILAQLEDDDVDVDVLGARVGRAAELIRLCRGRIRAAQMSVEEIVAELDSLAAGHDAAGSGAGPGVDGTAGNGSAA